MRYTLSARLMRLESLFSAAAPCHRGNAIVKRWRKMQSFCFFGNLSSKKSSVARTTISIFNLFSICPANVSSICQSILKFHFFLLHLSLIGWRMDGVDLFYVSFVASVVDNGVQAPTFLQEPLSRLIFSNDSGSQISCSAHGNPPPIVTWVHKDGSIVSSAPGLR